MRAYAVKHLVHDRGHLSPRTKRIKVQPFSLTSKEPEASDAVDNYVFVIEVRREKGGTSYWLGYKCLVADKVRLAGGGRWEDEFDFKNIGHYPPIGMYLDVPIQITDTSICEWLTHKQPGMAEIPALFTPVLDAMLDRHGRKFA